MDQKRKNRRFKVECHVKGTFKNQEKCLLKDINFEGLQLIASFLPIIGSIYTLSLKEKDQTQEFNIEVVRVNTGAFNADEKNGMPLGVTYLVGARFLDVTESKKQFLKSLLYSAT
ncbi:MAG: PilZ domain-containing protein [Candidatus Aminicenantes bacterium]|nr:PilZ domain-containing protein [Candidatus Aminicenantes bacterium]